MRALNQFDFIVTGAGIAGASVAAELAVKGAVCLLETESQPGYHSTGRSAALFSEMYGNRVVRSLSRAVHRIHDCWAGLRTFAPIALRCWGSIRLLLVFSGLRAKVATVSKPRQRLHWSPLRSLATNLFLKSSPTSASTRAICGPAACNDERPLIPAFYADRKIVGLANSA